MGCTTKGAGSEHSRKDISEVPHLPDLLSVACVPCSGGWSLTVGGFAAACATELQCQKLETTPYQRLSGCCGADPEVCPPRTVKQLYFIFTSFTSPRKDFITVERWFQTTRKITFGSGFSREKWRQFSCPKMKFNQFMEEIRQGSVCSEQVAWWPRIPSTS